MAYYLGGYYLMQLSPMNYGSQKDTKVFTCSNCINESLLKYWSYSWTTDTDAQIETIKQDYSISDKVVEGIRQWVDEQFNNNQIGWSNVFFDLQSVRYYRQTFFAHLPDLKIMSIYFEEGEANDLLQHFKPQTDKQGAIGLYQMLSEQIAEQQNVNEKMIGYDLIGIENSGDFHTFYCHDLAAELERKFALTTNEYGLLGEITEWKPVVDYMNNAENGFEPVPWFVAKIKLLENE
jgi:hypothetical protein